MIHVIKFFRRKDGNPARDESTDTRSAEYAASVKRCEIYICTLASIALYDTESAKDNKISAYKVQAVRILEEIKRFEERFASGKSSHGEAAQDAQKVVAPNSAPGTAPVRAVQILPSGRQLIFDLYCSNCYFQCWTCPTCDLARCACESCGCQLDQEREINVVS